VEGDVNRKMAGSEGVGPGIRTPDKAPDAIRLAMYVSVSMGLEAYVCDGGMSDMIVGIERAA